MGTVASIREQRHQALLMRLHQEASALVGQVPQQEIWLFGSHARGDWDARSDVDLLVVAADQQQAERLADASGLPSPMLATVRDALAKAEARLGYSMDHSAIIKWLETLTPPEPAKARPEPETKTGPA